MQYPGGRKQPHNIDEDVKIKQHVYLATLKGIIVPWPKIIFENIGVTFKQSGGTTHCQFDLELLYDHLKEFCHMTFDSHLHRN